MKIHLIDYATSKFFGSREMLHISARQYGIDSIMSYGLNKIKNTPFYNKNKALLSKSKGAGYWVWKPYIILDAISKLDEGDVLMYCDADQSFTQSPEILAEECREIGVAIYNSLMPITMWTKRDCFVIMDCDTEEYHRSCLGNGGFSCWMNNDICRTILKEWLYYAQDSRISTHSPHNVLGSPNFPDFIRHSTDQSMLGLLATKHGIKRLQPPGISEKSASLYKSLGMYRKCGNVIRRHGVFNMKQFKKISKQRELLFDGRQVYLSRINSPHIRSWANPFCIEK